VAWTAVEWELDGIRAYERRLYVVVFLCSFGPVLTSLSLAVSSVPANVSNDTDALSSYLAYHYVHGNADVLAAGGNSAGGAGGAGAGGGGGTATCTNSGSASCTPTGTGAGAGGPGSAPSTSMSSSAGEASVTASAYRLNKSFLHFARQSSSGNSSDQMGLDNTTAIFPNVTLGRTLLTAPNYVHLEGSGDRAQVLAWSRPQADGPVQILNQPYVSRCFLCIRRCSSSWFGWSQNERDRR